MAVERVLIFALAAASLISMACAIPGTATFYTIYRPSACYGNEDRGTLIAAANPGLYNNGAACGQRYTVQCTGSINGGASPCRNGVVTVTIVDRCAGCGPDQLDLSQEVFSTIADPNAGRIRIDYNRV